MRSFAMRGATLRCCRIAAVLPALALALAPAIGGCGSAPLAPVPPGASPTAPEGALELRHWRTVIGGFLAAPGPAFGVPLRPGSGAFVKLVAPSAVALSGNDLLIVDSGTARIWRADLALNTLSAVEGAPPGTGSAGAGTGATPGTAVAGTAATPGTAIALGPDLSAWVLDGVSRRIVRIARDGRLMQTYRGDRTAPSPVAIGLADGGSTLLVADSALRQWVEFRSVGAFSLSVAPSSPDAVRGVDGLAVTRQAVYLLDRSAGVVHVVRRDGQVLARLGEGELKQPVAIAVDRFERVFVLDAQDNSVALLRAGRPAQVFDAASLRVQQISGIAVDESFLAVADRLTGQVVIHQLIGSGRP